MQVVNKLYTCEKDINHGCIFIADYIIVNLSEIFTSNHAPSILKIKIYYLCFFDSAARPVDGCFFEFCLKTGRVIHVLRYRIPQAGRVRFL